VLFRLGVDVGGTNTDAVVLDEHDNLYAAVKTTTTEDVETGVYAAIDAALKMAGVDAQDVVAVMLGTTQCTNALVERRGLARVAVLRIGYPAGQCVEPFYAWPDDLKDVVAHSWHLVPGGFELDGSLIRDDLDEARLREIALRLRRERVEAAVVSCVFSPVQPRHELRARDILRDVLGPEFPVTLSAEVGSLGLLERENSAILNAALNRVAGIATRGLERALAARGIRARVFFTQNDGTLMSLERAREYPVLTISSGATNSMRGAYYLTHLEHCVVIDVGGTSTDVGILAGGFPTLSSRPADIGGVRTNFRMPDIVSCALGGGSVVREVNGEVTVGPESLGSELTRGALAWGGDTLTATDVVLALGRAEVEDAQASRARVDDLPRDLCQRAERVIVGRIEEALDRVKPNSQPLPAVLVGGGSILLPPRLRGISRVIRPLNHKYANAIGAAMGEIGGEVDRVWSLDQVSEEEAVRQAREMALRQAVREGADPGRVRVLNVEAVPVSYLPGKALRVRARAAGPLRFGGPAAHYPREEVSRL